MDRSGQRIIQGLNHCRSFQWWENSLIVLFSFQASQLSASQGHLSRNHGVKRSTELQTDSTMAFTLLMFGTCMENDANAKCPEALHMEKMAGHVESSIQKHSDKHHNSDSSPRCQHQGAWFRTTLLRNSSAKRKTFETPVAFLWQAFSQDTNGAVGGCVQVEK